MKKIGTLILLQAVVASFAIAQPVFTIDDLPNVGDLDTILHIDYSGNASDLATQTGNGYSWDFSDINFFPAFNNVHEFRTPQHAISAPYVDATIEEFANGVSGFEVVSLYEHRDDTLFIHRTGAGGTGTAHVPPIASVAFPISFGDSSYVVQSLYTSGILSGERKTTFHYDGFGTLMMPENRTFNNVFRIRKIETDTNYVINTVNTYENYIWYKQGGQIPILRIGRLGAGSFTAFGSKAAATTTGVQDADGLTSFEIFPNPTNGILQFGMGAEKLVSIELMDMKGKLLQSFGVNKAVLDVSDFSTGLYLLRVETENGVVLKKVLKQ